jgi:hypothetical protein
VADTTIDSIVAQAVAAAEAASAASDAASAKKKGTPMSAKTKARLQADLAKAKATVVTATKDYQNTPASAANYAEVKQRNDSAINAVNNIQGLLKANVEPPVEKPSATKPTVDAGKQQFTPAQMASYQYAQGLQSTLTQEYADLQNKINLYGRGAVNTGDKAALEKAANDYKATFAALQTAYQKSGVVQGDVKIDPVTGSLASGTAYVDPAKPQEGLKVVGSTGTSAPLSTTGAGTSQSAEQAAAVPVGIGQTTPAGNAQTSGTSGSSTGTNNKTPNTTTGSETKLVGGNGQFVPLAPGQTVPGAIMPFSATPFESSNPATQQQFVQQFGGIAAMAFSTPWIAALLDKAIVNKWDAVKFKDAFSVAPEFGAWGKAVQDQNLAYYGDPSHQAWAQQYNDKLEILRQSALQQGLDPSVFGEKIDTSNPNAIQQAFADKNNGVNAYLSQYYSNAPDKSIIDQYVANHANLQKQAGGALSGTIADTAQTLKSFAASMGVSSQYLTPSWSDANGNKVASGPDYFANAAQAIAQGHTTLASEQALYRAQAQNIYKPFAQQIANGYSVEQLANPYTSAVQNLLELGKQPIDLGSTTGYGSMVTKALMGDGTNPMNLDQFTTQVKQRPEWLQTSNARNSLMDTASQLLRNFGMVVGG